MKAVGIADLKAKLSQHLRTVRQGHRVTVLDRDRPIATIVPHEQDESLPTRKPLREGPPLQEVKLPPPLDLDLDIVDLLMADRQSNR